MFVERTWILKSLNVDKTLENILCFILCFVLSDLLSLIRFCLILFLIFYFLLFVSIFPLSVVVILSEEGEMRSNDKSMVLFSQKQHCPIFQVQYYVRYCASRQCYHHRCCFCLCIRVFAYSFIHSFLHDVYTRVFVLMLWLLLFLLCVFNFGLPVIWHKFIPTLAHHQQRQQQKSFFDGIPTSLFLSHL